MRQAFLDYPATVSPHDISKCEMLTSMVSLVLLKRYQTYSMYVYTCTQSSDREHLANKRCPQINAVLI